MMSDQRRSRSRVLLTSVFGPFAQDDEYESRLDWAFQHDFDVNGPSLFRMMRTTFEGWKRYGADSDPRIRARFAGEAAKLTYGYGAALWAMEKYLHVSNASVSQRVEDLRRQIERELGGLSRLIDPVVGPVLLWSARREAHAYPTGRALEPQTFVDRRNWA